MHSDWHIEDGNGKQYGQNPPPADAIDPRVVEYLERVEIISVRKQQQEEQDKARKELESELEALREKARELGYDIDKLIHDGEAGNQESARNDESVAPQGENEGFFANKLESGDQRFAGDYYCDEFLISLKKGQALNVTYQPDGYAGEILTGVQFSGDLFRNSGPRARGKAIGEELQVAMTAESDAIHIVRLMTRDKDTSGNYRVRFVLDGKILRAPDQFSPVGGEGNNRFTLK